MKAELNERITRIEPHTACGNLMRHYWQPIALVDEFNPTLDPGMGIRPVKAVRILGQDLVLFKNAQGQFGLLDRDCPHRGADLAFGRNEGDGLRCPFHGWKFDVHGQCMETPAEPDGSKLCSHIKQRNYPLIESSGILFGWLGAEGTTPPPLPALDCFTAPNTHTFAFKGLWQCNWLQAFEVGVDPAHASFLHRFFFDESLDDTYGKQFRGASAGDIHGERWPMTKVMREFDQPQISVAPMPFGMRLTSLRPMTDTLTHVRVTNAIFPHTFVIPLSETMTITQMHVPVDDTNTYWYSVFTSFAGPVDKEAMRNQRLNAISLPDYIPKSGRHNNWGFNPEEQNTRTYLGMGENDINVHDQWACESMGPIQDRTREHLGTSDVAVMANRRNLIKAIDDVEAGKLPLGFAQPDVAAQRFGPDTVDGIAPAQDWENWWQQAVMHKRIGAPWDASIDVKNHERSKAHQKPWLELVRFAWCDTHGMLRGKTLTASAAIKALDQGVSMVSTLMLKDTSDRTAFKVFEPSIAQDLPGFEFANSLLLKPIPNSFKVLPWADKTGWVQCQPVFLNGESVLYDTRFQLQAALDKLANIGLQMVCGLEVEFHIYRLHDAKHGIDLDPNHASWPGVCPEVSLIHPGYNLLSENCFDMAEEPLRIVQHTAQALGLPLLSLEIELGPSQVEAVFDATDALTAADNMVLFRSAVRQALRRAGYYATFMCRPPFDNIMSSGWHLHQSLVEAKSKRNSFMRDTPEANTNSEDARHTLSDVGTHYLAGLLNNAQGMTVMCTPTVNGFGRFRPNALAPQSILWGRDNRGAMLRVIGQAGDTATRIENRLGEPAANPYLYMASQIYAGLQGMQDKLVPPLATDSPYGDASDTLNNQAVRIPNHLGDALHALQGNGAMREGFGAEFLRYYARIKSSEQQRFDASEDKLEFQKREYFSRI